MWVMCASETSGYCGVVEFDGLSYERVPWALRGMWLDESVAEWSPELPQLNIDRMRGVVHDSCQLPSHPFLCPCIHTVEVHPHHRAGHPYQPGFNTSPDATSPTHNNKEDDIGYCRLTHWRCLCSPPLYHLCCRRQSKSHLRTYVNSTFTSRSRSERCRMWNKVVTIQFFCSSPHLSSRLAAWHTVAHSEVV